ncbi:hypothetical protein PLESTB_000474800 [Pleodorina starrii]|uniref:Uncharacterized protein n=1 Tax=Pleodorina starrii TaxID=330485 RepID=A0A9W6BFF4_9CHLO|nr:hypothetical protein PLESTM_001591900 [Pleodorina starrii]GLC51182.1 hypothetical protein PLESTB_000474800 [Pleodorina starrii]GLC63540.1 hypothetical protein PLESTF_000047300 [Pleodorina starrii]
MASTRSPRWGGMNSGSMHEMAVNNNLVYPGELGNWLDFSHGGARLGSDGCYEPSGAQFSLAEDCAFVLAADFPDAQGPFVLAGYPPRMETADTGFAATNSADVLNGLGGPDESTPRVTPFSAPCPSMSLPDDELPTACGVGKRTGSKASARAPKRGPPARGGRRGAVKKPARGREAICVPDGPGPVSLLYKGTIGGLGSLQELSLPWTLSLQQLNRTLAPPAEAWPEVVDS